jgi:TonB family protein
MQLHSRLSPPTLALLAATLGACATESAAVSESGAPAASGRTRSYTVRAAAGDDPEVGGVELQAEHGYISQEDAEDAIKDHWRDLVRCYDEAGAARAFAGGAVRLRFMVDLAGRVSAVQVLESRLGNFAVERCLVSVARTITVARPKGGTASFEYSLEFRSTGELAVIDLPEGQLDGSITAWLPQLAADCRQLGVDEMTATLYIEPHGVVRSVGFASTATLDADAADCVAQSLRRWNVPVPVKAGVCRTTLALHNRDLLDPPAPPPVARPAARRHEQGRRSRRH